MRKRTLLAGGAILIALGFGLGAQRVQSATQARATGAFKKLVARMPRLSAKAKASPGVLARTTNAFILDSGDTIFLDRDDDGEITFGDEFIVHGPLVNYNSGRDVGTWEGTLTVTNGLTFLTNITLVFAGNGTVTINGASYEDGARGNYFLAPIVGTTGNVRASGGAGFFNDSANNLVVLVGVR